MNENQSAISNVIFQFFKNNLIYTYVNNEKIYLTSDNLVDWNENLSLEYMHSFYFENIGLANSYFGWLFEQTQAKEIQLSILFKWIPMMILASQGFTGSEENIQELEEEKTVAMLMYCKDFSFEEILFLIDEETKEQKGHMYSHLTHEEENILVDEQDAIFNSFSLNPNLKEVISNIKKDNTLQKVITILSTNGEQEFNIFYVNDRFFVGYKVDDMLDFLDSLNDLYLNGGMILVREYLN